jgi:putative transposase
MQKSRKRHTEKEIGQKLARGETMASQGKTQAEIAKALGITVMTFSRWRKSAGALANAPKNKTNSNGQQGSQSRFRSLELENARLRDLVVRMLLDKEEQHRQAAFRS